MTHFCLKEFRLDNLNTVIVSFHTRNATQSALVGSFGCCVCFSAFQETNFYLRIIQLIEAQSKEGKTKEINGLNSEDYELRILLFTHDKTKLLSTDF